MPEEDNNLPKLDFGLSAKANFELKAEVPATSMGRLVDSLTDLIRPITEARGLRADQLRLQREDVLLDIANRTMKRLSFEQAAINPIPLKTIVPLLEKASLEDPGGTLIDWWAGLLASTATHEGLQHPVFSDLLARMTAAEAGYLRRMVETSQDDAIERQEVEVDQIFYTTVVGPLAERITGKDDEDYRMFAREHLDAFRRALESRACVVLSMSFPSGHVRFSRDTHEIFIPYKRTFRDILDVLQVTGIVKTSFNSLPVPSPFISEVSCTMEIVSLTNIGRQLLRACISKNDDPRGA